MEKNSINISKQTEKKHTEHSCEEGCVWPQILAILVGSLPSMMDGVLFVWTSPFIVKLVEDKVNYDITENEASKLTTIQPAVMVVSCLFLFNISDKLGRKKTLLLMSIPQIISLLLAAFAKNIYVFYVSRGFAGIASSLMWCSLPMYIGEVASPKVRGVWGTTLTSSVFVGQFFVNVIGSYFDAATTSYIFLPVPILFFIFFTFMPESPYFHLMKQNEEAARRSLMFLTRKKNVDDDLIKLKNDVNRQMSESGNWKDLINIRSNRKAVLIAFFLRFSQQFCGTSVLSQYTQFILEKAGGKLNPQVSSILYSGSGLIFNFFAVAFIVDRFKRKILYASSLCCCSLILFVFGTYFYVDKYLPELDLNSISWLPLTAVVSFRFTFSYGGAVIPTLMLGELFSTSIKAKAMMVSLFVFGINLFAVNMIFHLLTSSVGTYAPFFFFASITFVMSIFALYLVPETKGKTLEEIQKSFKQKTEG
ncbi:facilitated trehalose transporter Tret1-like [Diorhabda sublineata]|uniref:facilitated trehalose transporter Tret1-like n=1 Tax=Diorhabda sublineata TaxID=1163346 RepID=UPI0024E0A988|nr:facilitated trehalose transporter Tret1-like [Diorhabda sublineata]XP_056643807.1 facilitated trehalose transporter Tret1-like [Diorhabda sublineata]